MQWLGKHDGNCFLVKKWYVVLRKITLDKKAVLQEAFVWDGLQSE